MVSYSTSVRERAIRHMGRPVTLTNYSDDGSRDKYRDPDSFSTTTEDTYAVFQFIEEAQTLDWSSGQEVEVEATARFPESADLRVGVEDGVVKSTRIEDDTTGQTWEVVDVRWQPDGIQRALLTDI